MSSRGDHLALTILSDTHQLHRELDRLPGGDILICCGDFTMFSRSWSAVEDFADWFGEQPYEHKILTFGNHEFAFEADPTRRSVFGDTTVLMNERVQVDGLCVWGSPVTPLYGGAFGLSSSSDRQRHWARIPLETDVLITHGPPLGILDQSPGHPGHQGDPELLAAVQRVKPVLHCFGHIHGSFGLAESDGTTFVNAALLGPDGDLQHRPIHLKLPRRRRPGR